MQSTFILFVDVINKIGIIYLKLSSRILNKVYIVNERKNYIGDYK